MRFLLILAAAFSAAAHAADFYVVVPVKGRTGANAPAPEVSVSLLSASLPDTSLAQAYYYDFKTSLSVTGEPNFDSSQASWAGSGIPAGLSLSTQGVLHGTPTASGAYTFSISASYNGKSAYQTYPLIVHRFEGLIDFDGNWSSSFGGGTAGSGMSLGSVSGQTGSGSLASSTASSTGTGSVTYQSAVNFGTADFTIEILGYRTGRNGAYSAGLVSFPIAGGTVELLVDDVTSGQAYPSFTIAGGTYGTRAYQVPLNQWVKYKLARKNGVVRFYVNDTQMPISTYNTSYADDFTSSSVNELSASTALNSSSVVVGNRASLSRQWRGYIDGFRLILD